MPLTELCGIKSKFIWTDAHENAFNLAKKLVAEDVLLRFPNHELPFEFLTDASNIQVGATIKQNNLPIAYFSKKLTPTHRRYSTIEQEMLVIIKVLKEYRNFLLGARITIFTDHKNLLSNATVNNRVFRWKQKIQEFSPILQYVKVQDNVEADVLSRLPMDTEAHEVVLNHPPMDPNDPLLNKNPLDLKYIHECQAKDSELQKAFKLDDQFILKSIQEVPLIHFKDNESEYPKIVTPYTIQYTAIRLMHSLLGHAGISRLSATLRKHFWSPQMTRTITEFVKKCNFCQRFNKQTFKYGHVPPKQVKHLNPWEEISVDMIGPWKVTINNFEYQFRALTCIDTISSLSEIVRVENATSRTIVSAFENNWLSRYPAPVRCLHDNGNEILGPAFSLMLAKSRIKSVRTTVKNHSQMQL